MLLSYTSSEENIPYLGKVAQNIRNNDEGLKLFEDTADWHVCLQVGSRLRQFFTPELVS